MVTVNELKNFMSKFIEINGQNDNQNLLNKSEQIKYLDNFSGDELKSLKEEYKIKYEISYGSYNNVLWRDLEINEENGG